MDGIAEKVNEISEKMQLVIATREPEILEELRGDSIISFLDEVKDGKPVKHKKKDLDPEQIRDMLKGNFG